MDSRASRLQIPFISTAFTLLILRLFPCETILRAKAKERLARPPVFSARPTRKERSPKNQTKPRSTITFPLVGNNFSSLCVVDLWGAESSRHPWGPPGLPFHGVRVSCSFFFLSPPASFVPPCDLGGGPLVFKRLSTLFVVGLGSSHAPPAT